MLKISSLLLVSIMALVLFSPPVIAQENRVSNHSAVVETEPHHITAYRQTGDHAKHEAFCASCTEWITESHTWISISVGYVCRFCYFDP